MGKLRKSVALLRQRESTLSPRSVRVFRRRRAQRAAAGEAAGAAPIAAPITNPSIRLSLLGGAANTRPHLPAGPRRPRPERRPPERPAARGLARRRARAGIFGGASPGPARAAGKSELCVLRYKRILRCITVPASGTGRRIYARRIWWYKVRHSVTKIQR